MPPARTTFARAHHHSDSRVASLQHGCSCRFYPMIGHRRNPGFQILGLLDQPFLTTTASRGKRSSMLRRLAFAWLFGLLLSIALAGIPTASAADGALRPEIQRLVQALGSAKGVEKHAGIRALFALWDESDPLQVEQALVA